jgi:hypothetical protein
LAAFDVLPAGVDEGVESFFGLAGFSDAEPLLLADSDAVEALRLSVR